VSWIALRQAWQAEDDCQRQWERVHQQYDPRLGRSGNGRTVLHRQRKAIAEGFIESFNGRLRDELLNNETLFSSLPAAPASLIKWRLSYNGSRPDSQLNWQTPNEFASTFTPRRALALRKMESSAPPPVSSTADQGKTNAGNQLNAG
jgi:hypothetical protein